MTSRIGRADGDRLEQVRVERDHLASKGRLARHHWVAIVLSLTLTFVAAFVTRNEVNAKAEAEFGRSTDRSLALLTEQLRHYEGALWGGVAAIQANGGQMDDDRWEVYADTLEIVDKYPGATGIGIIYSVADEDLDAFVAEQQVDRPTFTVHPPHTNTEFLPITSIQPVETNSAAVGLDMAFEANRYSGIDRARATGEAQMTGPIILVQDAGQTPGFLFYAPWYDGNDANPYDRQENFVGAVYAPFVVEDLVTGALATTDRKIALTITDGGERLFDDNRPSDDGYDADPMFERQTPIDIYGREWLVTTRTTLGFREASANNEPLIILLGGLVIDGLLIAMFAGLSRSNRRALQYADDLTSQLVNESARLEQSNVELERFAYVASHDLKTPLRGIGNLAEWIEEDIDEYFDGDDAGNEIKTNLGRMRHQLERMNTLIAGLLEYSRVGYLESTDPSSINLADHLRDLRLDLGLGEDQIVRSGPAVIEATGDVLLLQVVSNLVNNAVQHHPSVPDVKIHFDVSVGPKHVMISIGDNGPGIEPEYRERVFDVFQTLGGTGTGIGLSVVRKIVDRQGGSIHLQSSPGSGAVFTIHWPIRPQAESRNASDASAATKELART